MPVAGDPHRPEPESVDGEVATDLDRPCVGRGCLSHVVGPFMGVGRFAGQPARCRAGCNRAPATRPAQGVIGIARVGAKRAARIDGLSRAAGR